MIPVSRSINGKKFKLKKPLKTVKFKTNHELINLDKLNKSQFIEPSQHKSEPKVEEILRTKLACSVLRISLTLTLNQRTL